MPVTTKNELRLALARARIPYLDADLGSASLPIEVSGDDSSLKGALTLGFPAAGYAGDTQLTLSQRVPVSGAIIVTTPQDIALLGTQKGLTMFRKVNQGRVSGSVVEEQK